MWGILDALEGAAYGILGDFDFLTIMEPEALSQILFAPQNSFPTHTVMILLLSAHVCITKDGGKKLNVEIQEVKGYEAPDITPRKWLIIHPPNLTMSFLFWKGLWIHDNEIPQSLQADQWNTQSWVYQLWNVTGPHSPQFNLGVPHLIRSTPAFICARDSCTDLYQESITPHDQRE